MKAFVTNAFEGVMAHQQWRSFDDLWSAQLEEVDDINERRGGRSSVVFLDAEQSGDGVSYFIKRQENHLGRSVHAPFGEPTYARELRNIWLYERHGVPAIEAVYYAEQRTAKDYRAILVTKGLVGYRPLDHWFSEFSQLPEQLELLMITAAKAIAQLHAAGIVHFHLYPKHVFVDLDNKVPVRFIDLENSRKLLFPKRAVVKELEVLIRRSPINNRHYWLIFLEYYLATNPIGMSADELYALIDKRKANKEARS